MFYLSFKIKKILKRLTDYVNDRYPNWDISIALRYLPIVEKIKAKIGKSGAVLDVGSGEFGIFTYLGRDYNVVGTDLDFGKKREGNFTMVKASAEKLPFEDNSFPAVVSVDMLEHLPKRIREKSISEMIRVSSRYVIISSPSGSLSSIVDRFISFYYTVTHKEKLKFLDEHIKYGLPKKKDVLVYVKKSLKKHNKKASVKVFENTNIFLWVFLLLMGFSQVKIFTYIYHKLVLFTKLLNNFNFWPTYRLSIYIDVRSKSKYV